MDVGNATEARPWPADQVERWPLVRLLPALRNARTHSDQQIASIAASMREWGWTNPVLVSEDGRIIAGHGRVAAAKILGWTEAPVMVARGWTDAQTRAYALADNKLALEADWDEELLRLELGELRELSVDLALVGFSDGELTEIFEPESPGSDGSLLAVSEITIAEPRTLASKGDIWHLGKHVLAVCSVVKDWPVWSQFLNTADALFCPFPGPFILASDRAKEHRLVLVQPDTYAAGHLVDRFINLFGTESVRKHETAQ